MGAAVLWVSTHTEHVWKKRKQVKTLATVGAGSHFVGVFWLAMLLDVGMKGKIFRNTWEKNINCVLRQLIDLFDPKYGGMPLIPSTPHIFAGTNIDIITNTLFPLLLRLQQIFVALR